MPDRIYKPSTLYNLALGASSFIAAGSLAVSVVFVIDDAADDRAEKRETEERIEQEKAALAQRQRASCADYNLNVATPINKNNDSVAFLLNAFTFSLERDAPVAGDPEGRTKGELVDALIAANQEARAPMRDCSPEGIREFFAGQPEAAP